MRQTALEGKADLNDLMGRFFAARAGRLEGAIDAAVAELQEEVAAAAEKAARRQEVTKRITSAAAAPHAGGAVFHARTGSGDLDRMLSDKDAEGWLQRSVVLSPVRGNAAAAAAAADRRGAAGRARGGSMDSQMSALIKSHSGPLGSICESPTGSAGGGGGGAPRGVARRRRPAPVPAAAALLSCC